VAIQIFETFGESSHDWKSIAHDAFNFPTPIVDVGDHKILELFHGPTAAFKDYGARFLARVLSAISAREQVERTILVATSGDTGGAVASAFFGVPNIRVVILYPKGRISDRQETQLNCWGENVTSTAVLGTFDDCQRMVKAAFSDRELRATHGLSSANSINVGRLIPQMSYYGWSSLALSTGEPVDYCIPTGNLGNALASVWAKRVGFPIGSIQLATNANPTLVEFFDSGEYAGRDAIATHANAMDVGDPSNFERLHDLLPDRDAMLAFGLSVASVTDETIERQIRSTYEKSGYVLDPHTACAVSVAKPGAVVAATADPAKFEQVVEPIVGPIEMPPQLAALMQRKTRYQEIAPTLDALHAVLRATG
jgi:threonine synthase